MKSEMQICSKFNKELELNNFYKFKDNTQDTICKECRLEGRKDWRPSDYFPLFELYDIPLIYSEWNGLVDRQIRICVIENKPYKSIFGKYLNKMKLSGFKHYTWKDTDNLKFK